MFEILKLTCGSNGKLISEDGRLYELSTEELEKYINFIRKNQEQASVVEKVTNGIPKFSSDIQHTDSPELLRGKPIELSFSDTETPELLRGKPIELSFSDTETPELLRGKPVEILTCVEVPELLKNKSEEVVSSTETRDEFNAGYRELDGSTLIDSDNVSETTINISVRQSNSIFNPIVTRTVITSENSSGNIGMSISHFQQAQRPTIETENLVSIVPNIDHEMDVINSLHLTMPSRGTDIHEIVREAIKKLWEPVLLNYIHRETYNNIAIPSSIILEKLRKVKILRSNDATDSKVIASALPVSDNVKRYSVEKGGIAKWCYVFKLPFAI
jgi:hypothetical protein